MVRATSYIFNCMITEFIENSMFTSSPPAASPYKAPPTVTPKLQDCLQSAGDIVQEMKRVTKAGTI